MNDDVKKGARMMALALLTGAVGADDESDVCGALAQLTEGARARLNGGRLTQRDFGGAPLVSAPELLAALDIADETRAQFEDAR